MESSTLSAVFAAGLSLALAYIPGLADWWNAISGTQKRGFMALAIVLIGAGAFAISCSGWFVFVACGKDAANQLISSIVLALAANQGMFKLAAESAQRARGLRRVEANG